MRKLFLISSFFVLLLSLSSHGWSLPPCSSDFWHNCLGTFTWKNGKFEGDKYVGEWKNNKKHEGTYYYLANNKNQGDIYSGEYKEGLPHGEGTYHWASGSKYVGSFRNGKKHGQGTYIFANGDKYVGNHKNGKKHGRGTFTWAGGSKYVGNHKNGKIHGQGIFTWADRRKDVGEFKNGMLNGFAIRYDKNGNVLKEGMWKNDKFLYAKKKSTTPNPSFKLDKYKRFCKEIGFSLGTEKFANCVLEAMKKG